MNERANEGGQEIPFDEAMFALESGYLARSLTWCHCVLFELSFTTHPHFPTPQSSQSENQSFSQDSVQSDRRAI